jgi:hypothetical protein
MLRKCQNEVALRLVIFRLSPVAIIG